MSEQKEDDPVLKKINIVCIGIVSPIIITVSILYGLGII
jgi:hypothetical protein